jgi:hypothetical protein
MVSVPAFCATLFHRDTDFIVYIPVNPNMLLVEEVELSGIVNLVF